MSPSYQSNFVVAQVSDIAPPPTNTDRSPSDFLAAGFPLTFAVLGSLLGVWFLKSFLVICKPNEVVILSGRKWRTPGGQRIGYRVLTGGRAVRIPIVETVKRMDVTTMAVPVE
ncbi:MAG: flotillin family protein, partial [Thermosynechococcaceae cyanobacterium]